MVIHDIDSMSLRTASQNNGILLAAILLFSGWTVYTFVNVYNSMGALTLGNWVGQHGVGGLFGLVGLLVILGLSVTVYGSLSETEPTPQEWPPE